MVDAVLNGVTNLTQGKTMIKQIPKHINKKQVIGEIKYLRETFGVIFTNDIIKWKTKQVVIENYNLGRFFIIYDKSIGSFYCKPCWKNKKLPHQYVDHTHPTLKGYHEICMGDDAKYLARNYKFYALYHTCNIIIQNYNGDALYCSQFVDKLEYIPEHCNNITMAEKCGECRGYYFDECSECLNEDDIDDDDEW